MQYPEWDTVVYFYILLFQFKVLWLIIYWFYYCHLILLHLQKQLHLQLSSTLQIKRIYHRFPSVSLSTFPVASREEVIGLNPLTFHSCTYIIPSKIFHSFRLTNISRLALLEIALHRLLQRTAQLILLFQQLTELTRDLIYSLFHS